MADWDDYRFSLATIEHGSFSAAARALQVSQPTVSRRIGQLEKRLGARLFDHRNVGLVLTEPGRGLVDLSRTMEATAHRLALRVKGLNTAPSGKVTLTTTSGLGSHWLAPKLEVFRDRFPDIEVSLILGGDDCDLLRGEADIAIRFGGARAQDLVGKMVGYAHSGIYASEGYFAAYGTPEKLSDLLQHHFIEATGQLAKYQQCQKLNEIMSSSPRGACVNSVYPQIAMAQAGLGLIAVICYMADSATGLKRVLAKEFDMAVEFWLLVHPDLKDAARVRALYDFLYTELRKDTRLFKG
jgi:DNA-binding transcriptional LysR family regulator